MIRLDDVGVTFNPGTPQEHSVLSGLSLSIPPGEFVTVIGGNGAGKSTLMGVLAGETAPSCGRVWFDDIDVTRIDAAGRAAHVARVFQDPNTGTCHDLSVGENLALALMRGQPRRLRPARSAQRMRSLRERVALLGMGLEDRLDTPVALLSGGQRQSLSLLMATLQPSKLLLLDEHTAALDPKMAQVVLALTRKLVQEQNLTAVMVTHAMDVALAFGQRTIMLEAGQVRLDISGEARRQVSADDLHQRFHS